MRCREQTDRRQRPQRRRQEAVSAQNEEGGKDQRTKRDKTSGAFMARKGMRREEA
jgi:hypothetical protein